MKPYHAKPVLQRIEEKSSLEPNSGCWLWEGQLTSRGYGKIWIGSRTDGSRRCAVAHRAAYEAARAVSLDGRLALHSCDNPLCVNPDHIRPGTVQDNSDDMVKRGRSMKGARVKRKLSDEDVRTIRSASGLQREIAAQFGITQGAVSQIKLGKKFHAVGEV